MPRCDAQRIVFYLSPPRPCAALVALGVHADHSASSGIDAYTFNVIAVLLASRAQSASAGTRLAKASYLGCQWGFIITRQTLSDWQPRVSGSIQQVLARLEALCHRLSTADSASMATATPERLHAQWNALIGRSRTPESLRP